MTDKLYARVAIALAVIGATYSLIATDDGVEGAFLIGLGSAMLGCLVVGVFSIFKKAMTDAASQYSNPFARIGAAVIAAIMVSFVFDIVLLRGNYLTIPAISIVVSQSLDGTLYSCKKWVDAEGGSFCDD